VSNAISPLISNVSSGAVFDINDERKCECAAWCGQSDVDNDLIKRSAEVVVPGVSHVKKCD